MSKLKEIFTDRRTPIPLFILDLFPNDEFTIDNEQLFFERIQQRFAETMILEKDFENYDSVEYFFFRICESIEKNIQKISNLQQKDYQDAKAIALYENNIRVMMAIIDKALGYVASIRKFRFLYFDDILDLAPSIGTLQTLTMLGLKLVQVYNHERESTAHILSLYAFMIPFYNLISRFEQDLQAFMQSVSRILEERRNTNGISEALEKILLMVLQDNQSSLDDIKAYYLRQGMDNRQLFITELTTIVCEKNKFTKQNNQESYFQTLGAITLVSFLLGSQLDEQITSVMLLAQAITRAYYKIHFLKSSGLFSSPDLKFSYPCKPSAVDILLTRVKNAAALDYQADDKIHQMELLLSYLDALSYNIEHLTSETKSELCNRLFHSSPEDAASKSAVDEIYDSISKMYSKHFSNAGDETGSMIRILNKSLKDMTNFAMSSLIKFISNLRCVVHTGGLFGGSANTVQSQALKNITERVIQKIECFNLETNYITLEVLYETVRMIPYSMNIHDLQICLRTTKVIEKMVEWSCSPGLVKFFEKERDSSLALKANELTLELLSRIILQTMGHDRESYQNHLATFQTIDFISKHMEFKHTVTNQSACKAQEQIIRVYLNLHLCTGKTSSGLFSRGSTFYNVDRLKQVWKLILFFSDSIKSVVDEFRHTHSIFQLLDQNAKELQNEILNLEVLTALYKNSVPSISPITSQQLKDSQGFDLKSFKEFSKSPQYEDLIQVICDVLKENFEEILSEAEALKCLHSESSAGLTKKIWRLEYYVPQLFQRFYSFVELKNSLRPEDTTNNAKMQEVLDTYFFRFLDSPILYMIKFQSISHFMILMKTEGLRVLNRNYLPQYATKVVELAFLVSQHDPSKNIEEQSLLEKMVDLLYYKERDLDLFYRRNFYEDVQEVFTVNSRLFLVAFLNRLEPYKFDSTSDEDAKLSEFIDILERNVSIIVKSSQALTYSNLIKTIKDIPRYSIYSGNAGFKEEGLLSNYNNSKIQAYFQRRNEVVIQSLLDFNIKEISEENLIERFAIIMNWQSLLARITRDDLLTLFQGDNAIENLLEVSFQALFTFIQLLSTHTSNASDSPLDRLNLQINQDTKYMKTHAELIRFMVPFRDTITNQFEIITEILTFELSKTFVEEQRIRLKETQAAYVLRAGGAISQYLDSIDNKLAFLIVSDRMCSSNLKNISSLKSIYYCCESIINMQAHIQTMTLLETKRRDNFDRVDFEKGKTTYRKFLSKFIVLYESGLPTPKIDKAYRRVFCQVLADIARLYNDNVHEGNLMVSDSRDGYLGCIQFHQNPTINKLRTLFPVVEFLVNFRNHNSVTEESEHQFYVKAVQFLVKMIGSLNQQLSIEEISAEKEFLHKTGFIPLYESTILILIQTTDQKLMSIGSENSSPQDFFAAFDDLYTILSHWKDVLIAYKDDSTVEATVFKQKLLIVLFYFGLMSNKTAERLALDGQLLVYLINQFGRYFYMIMEAYALKAFDPEKILSIKLKSIAYLDSTGKRTVNNPLLEFFDRRYKDIIQDIKKKKFLVQKLKDKQDNVISQARVPNENPDMKGKTEVNLEDNTRAVVSVLTYLKQGINQEAKLVVETLVQNVILCIEKHLTQILKKGDEDDEATEDNSKLLKTVQDRIGILSLLVRNYPELAVTITSHVVEKTILLTDDYPKYIPQWTGKWTFLRFFIRYACYFYNFSVKHFLEQLVTKHQTPILVEYENEIIPLSVYNEFLIYREILEVLQETLEVQEEFLKTLYIVGVWNILPNICFCLLSQPQENMHQSFRLQFIESLYSLCLKALEVYSRDKMNGTAFEEDEIGVIYICLVRLAEFRIAFKVKLRVMHDKQVIEQLMPSTKSLLWMSHTLKEEFYTHGKIELEQVDVEPSKLDLNGMTTYEEVKAVESYSLDIKSISRQEFIAVLKDFVNYSAKTDPRLGSTDLINYPVNRSCELHIFLDSCVARCKPKEPEDGTEKSQEQKAKDTAEIRVADSVVDLLKNPIKKKGLFGGLKAVPLSKFAPTGIHLAKFAPIFIFKNKKIELHKDSISNLKSGQDLEASIEMTSLIDIQPKKTINKETISDLLSKKKGLSSIEEIIDENKLRLKTLLQVQQEQFLMAKLEVLLNRQVSINDVMSVQIDVDNMKFFEEQNDQDKELILLLANRDFIKTLRLEKQMQSKDLQQKYSELVSKDDEEEEEEEEEEDDEDEEEEEEEEQDNNSDNNIDEENSDGFNDNIQINRNEVENQSLNDQEEDSDFGEEQKDEVEMDNLIENQEKKVVTEQGETDQKAIAKSLDTEQFIHPNKHNNSLEPIHLEQEAKAFSFGGEEQSSEEDCILTIPQKTKMDLEKDRESVNEDKGDDPEPIVIESIVESTGTYEYSQEVVLTYDAASDKDYNWITLVPKDDSLDTEFELMKRFMEKAGSYNKILQDTKFFERPNISYAKPNPTQISAEELIKSVFLAIASYKKNDISTLENFYEVSNCSIIATFFININLDPSNESLILPLLALYLVDYIIEFEYLNAYKEGLKDKIVELFYHYSIRSPSIFFKTFTLSTFTAYMGDRKVQGDTLEKFSLLEVLVLLLSSSNQSQEEVIVARKLLLIRLIGLLVRIRFIEEDIKIPKYIRQLREHEEPPLRAAILERFSKYGESCLNAKQDEDFTSYYQLLKCMLYIPDQRKLVLMICDKLLSIHTQNEKTTLNIVIQQAKEALYKEDLTVNDNKACEGTVIGLVFNVNRVQDILNNILDQIMNSNFNVNEYVDSIMTIETRLNELSLCYMEAFELVARLHKAEKFADQDQVRTQLQALLRMPLQYYLYLSKIKDLKTAVSSVLDKNKRQYGGLTRRFSSFGTVGKLERSYSLLRLEVSNFREVLSQWMMKNKESIGEIFGLESTDSEEEETDSVRASDMHIMKKLPWIMNFEKKGKNLMRAIATLCAKKTEISPDVPVRRDYLLEDSFTKLQQIDHSTKDFVGRIKFIDEVGIDAGGLKREWLTLLTKELFDPSKGLFKLSSNMNTVHPNPLSIIQPLAIDYFRFAGTLVGMAIKEEIPIDVNFSKSFLKLLIGMQPTLQDIEDIEPELTSSLQWMLENEVADLEQPFTYELNIFGINITQELEQNGSDLIVDEINKELYVSRLCMVKSLEENEEQIKSFKDGLFEIVPVDAMKVFSSGELAILISGQPEVDVVDLKDHTRYGGGYSKDNKLIEWFWEIVESMDQAMLANLSRQIDVPNYESKEQLHEKLLLAINEGVGGFHIG